MNIEQQLVRDEGRELRPYPDSIKKLWTAGVGHCFQTTNYADIPAAFKPEMTDAQCDALFAADLMHVRQLFDVYVPWWKDLDGIDGPRSNVLVNMAFNMGVPGVAKFHQFLDLMKQRQWQRAADDLATTQVFKQLPERYGRLKKQITSGEWV